MVVLRIKDEQGFATWMQNIEDGNDSAARVFASVKKQHMLVGYLHRQSSKVGLGDQERHFAALRLGVLLHLQTRAASGSSATGQGNAICLARSIFADLRRAWPWRNTPSASVALDRPGPLCSWAIARCCYSSVGNVFSQEWGDPSIPSGTPSEDQRYD